MEEQILKQIKNYSDQAIKINGHRVLIDHNFKLVAQKSNELVHIHYLDFAVWVMMEGYTYFESGTDGDENYIFSDMEGNKVLFEDIYQFWFHNIKQQ